MLWTQEEILLATAGQVVQEGEGRFAGEVVTHSDKVIKGSVFVALVGEKFDGHDFLKAAVRRGASCLIVHRRLQGSTGKSATVIRVADTLAALGDLAHYRREILAPKVLAITGSNGKTTTKEMVAAILERGSLYGRSLRGKVLKTEGNYNNLVGLPLTLLRLRGETEVAVLELGTSRPGEINRLTEIADPDIGLITSVAPAHLEGLRSVAGVAEEKGELFQGIRPGGIAVVNLEDPWARRMGDRYPGDKIAYGKGGEVRGESCEISGKGIEFTLRVGKERARVRLKLCGRHNFINALGAAAVAYGLGAGVEAMRKGLESVRPLPMRMAVETWRGAKIINDAYNANPASMESALRSLVAMRARGEKIAVLGDMLELGEESPRHHRELGKKVARYGVDRLYLLGDQAAHVERGALSGGLDGKQVVIGKSHNDVAEMVRKQMKSGDLILFKASRGMHLERVLAALKKEAGA